jgi:organic hydroperoxide reductase OsmC/OhrA
MQAFPHRYTVTSAAAVIGEMSLESERLPTLRGAPPLEFDGPGDRWSPETLVVAAVAGCYVLTFRAIAGLAKLSWHSLQCDVEGTVNRVDRVTRFTQFRLRARLRVPPGTDEDHARQLLARAEHACLVTHSLNADFELEAAVEVAAAATTGE